MKLLEEYRLAEIQVIVSKINITKVQQLRKQNILLKKKSNEGVPFEVHLLIRISKKEVELMLTLQSLAIVYQKSM